MKLATFGWRSRSQWRNIHFFLHNSLLTSLPCNSALLCLIKMKFRMSLRYTLGHLALKFHKIRMGDHVIMTSFKFNPNNWSYLKFYWTYKLRTWNQYIIIYRPSKDKNKSDLDGRRRSLAKVKGHWKWTNGHMSQTITLTNIIPGTKVSIHLIT